MKVISAILLFLTSRWFFMLLGLIAIAVLIWIGGPHLTIAGHKPLETVLQRGIAIGAIVLLVILFEGFKYWRARQANKKMIEGLVDSEELVSLTEVQSREEMEILKERFQEALAVLKETTVKSARGDYYVYELPWYVVIGPPGSGKTTILRNSGLDFPLAERLGVDSVQGVGGTRNCDWWFTNEAVLIDTAGRYTTQDSNVEVDRAAWRGFLDLLKSHRRRRPINGIVLAISLSDVMEQRPEERKAHVAALKKRLQELMRTFGMRLPVYLVLTKADLINGFTEYFDDLGREGREQVWGVTFPFDGAEMPATLIPKLEEELDTLVARVGGRLLPRLHAERDLRRRSTMYAFPQQLASVKSTITEFVGEVFQANRFEMQPVLRGVYLTSGTQEGTPIDRLMTAFADAFNVSGAQVPAFSGRGRAFFIHDLLQKVVVPEANLVGSDRRHERRLVFGHIAAYVIAAIVIAAAATAWTMAYFDTNEKLATVAELVGVYDKSEKAIANSPQLSAALPPLNALAEASSLFSGGVIDPLLTHFGITAEINVQQPVHGAYDRAIIKLLAPRLLLDVQNSLRSALQNGAPVDTVRQLLATYLMLGDPAKLDTGALTAYTAAAAQSQLPGNTTAQNQLVGHMKTLVAAIDRGAIAQGLPLDQSTVQAARGVISQVSPSEQVFDTLDQIARSTTTIPQFNLLQSVSPLANQVFTFKDGKVLSIPGFYTQQGFFKVFLPKLPTISKADSQADWVLGRQAAATVKPDNLSEKVTKEYQNDYITQWMTFLSAIRVVPFRSTGDAERVLQLLAGDASPLDALLKEIKTNTDLGVPQPTQTGGGGILATAESAVAAASGAVSSAVAGGSWPGTPIQNQFKSLNSVIDASKGQAPITDIKNSIAGVYGMVQQLGGAGDPGEAAYKVAVARMQPGNQDALSTLRQQSVTLPQPVGGWLTSVAESTWGLILEQAKTYVDNQYKLTVLPSYQRSVAGRYPVVPTALSDAPIQDFGKFFGPGGDLDNFYLNILKPFVKEQPGSWLNATVDGRSLGLAPDTLEAFHLGQQIRDSFFLPGAKDVQFSFTMKPTYLDPRVASINWNISGDKFSYRHEPPRAQQIDWPSKDGTGGASVQLLALNGLRRAYSFDGSWALFKLFNTLKLGQGSQPDIFSVILEYKEMEAHYQLEAASTINPFDLSKISQFQLPPTL